MPRVKIKLADNITRVVFVETDATVGATIGTDLKLPSGQVATVAQLQALLGIATGEPEPTDHRLLLGLTVGDDHPQYTRKDTLTTRGDLYARGSTTVQRLALGSDRQFFRSGALDPAWETVSPTVTLGTDLSGNVTLTNLASGTLGATIVANAVTDTKLRDSAGLSVIGRSANTTGDPGDITGTDGQILRVAGTALGFGSILSTSVSDFNEAAQDAVGNILTDSSRIDFTYSDGGNTITADITLASVDTAYLTNNAVTDTKLRDSAALSVIGRALNSTGDPGDLTAGSDGDVLRRSGTTLGFGTVATAGLTDDAVTNAKLANMVQASIKGRADAAGTGDPTDLTGAQVATIVGYTAADVLTKLLTVDGAGSLLDADLLDGVQGADYARISVANTFTSGSLSIAASLAFLSMLETDQVSDEQIWAHFVNGKVYSFQTYAAGFAGARTHLAFTRGTGAAVTNIAIGNTTDNATVGFLGTGAVSIGGALSVTGAVTVPNTSFTYAKLQNVSATSRVLGRITAGAGVIEELTAANLATIVNTSLDHATLLNLTTGDPHTQYTQNASAEVIAAAWNFTTRQQVFGTTTANIALVSGLADTGTSLHVVENLKFHRVGAEPFFILNRINGSYASPTALLNSQTCGGILLGGYNGTTMSAQSGFIEYITSEDWSGTAQGGNLRFQTTIAGTTTRQVRLILGADATGAFARLPSGVEAQPGWSFLSDTDTGIYLVGTNSMGLSTGGTLRVTLNTASLTSTLPIAVTGNVTLSAAGNKLLVKEGTNAAMGVATLVLGTVTVNTTVVTANSRILLTVQSLGTVAVATPVAVTARVAATSFTITSASATDTSVVAWHIFEPA